MKKLFFFIVAFQLFFNVAQAVEYNSDPKIFIEELVGDALKTLSDKNTSDNEKKKAIEKIATENVDIKALGMYTLGDIRKTLGEDDLKEYNSLFKDYFLKSLTSRLGEYSSKKFLVTGSDKKSSTYTIVSSKISQDSSSPEIKINWRVYTKDSLKPLIRDLIVEGLSLARTQKEEFSSILKSNNNDNKILFEKLNDFISS